MSEKTGLSRAFIVIRDVQGKAIGHGEFTQTIRGSEANAKLSLQFRDGSLDEETIRYSQTSTLRLLHDHHLQRGASFPTGLDQTLDASSGITNTTVGKDGSKTETTRVVLPPDTVNGLLGPALLNFPPHATEQKYSFVAPIGEGRIVQLKVTPDHEAKFSIADATYTAEVYRIHFELGGMMGMVAPLMGKQPADSLVWVAKGVPTLVREQTILSEGGPAVSLELAGASFPDERSAVPLKK